jgi:hypothetical protein
VSESTLEAPAVPPPDSPEPRLESPRAHPLAFIRRHPWWVVAVLLVGFSTALVYWSGTRPGYDPYGWLIWGYQTVHLKLDLGGAPSWKPLPWLFTVPYSLFGGGALRLWMITSVSLSLSATIFAGRIAYRLTRSGDGNRWPAIAAAVFAGFAVLGIQDYMHYILSAQSDSVIVALCLGAVDCHLSGRPRWAFAMLVLASLGRPEAWAFLGLYSIWAWRAVRSMRWLIAAGLALIPILWFGVPTITNGRPFVSAQLALRSPRELHESKITGVIDRFTALTYLPVQLAALLALVLAWFRRNWTVLALGAAVVAWVVIEIAFALHGWAAVPRYIFEAAGLTCVLAGICVGWLLQGLSRGRFVVPRLAGVALVLVLIGTLVPGAVARIRTEHRDLKHERARTVVIGRLKATIAAIGGYKHVLACGEPVTTVRYVAMLAYFTKQNDGKIGHRPKFELQQKYPIVMFEKLHSGWKTVPWHTAPNNVRSCANVNSSFLYTRHHPTGVLVPNQ